MKKSTKKTLAALVIILIFAMSSVAFVIGGLQIGTPSQGGQVQPLTSYVVDTPIAANVETAYIQNHYTFLIFYYANKDQLYDYVASLPSAMTVPTGETQLFVNRLQANETRANIVNLNGNFPVTDITQQGIFNELCKELLFTPTNCLLANLSNQSGQTATNSSA